MVFNLAPLSAPCSPSLRLMVGRPRQSRHSASTDFAGSAHPSEPMQQHSVEIESTGQAAATCDVRGKPDAAFGKDERRAKFPRSPFRDNLNIDLYLESWSTETRAVQTVLLGLQMI